MIWEIYYIAMVAIAMIILFLYLYLFNNNYNDFASAIICIFALMTLAYITMYFSDSKSEASLAYSIIIFGECFLPVVTTIYLLSICNIKINKYFISISAIISLILFSISCIKTEWVFKDLDIYVENGKLIILEERNTIHTLILLMLVVYLVANLFIILFSKVNKLRVSDKSLLIFGIGELIAIVLMFFARKMELLYDFSFGSVLLEGLTLLVFYRTRFYTLNDYVANEIIKADMIGYISFDNERRFLGCNDIVIDLFPEFSNCVCDKQIDSLGIKGVIQTWFDRLDKGEKKINDTFKTRDYIILVSMEKFKMGRKKQGYRVLLRNDTERRKLIEMLALERKEADQRRAEVTHTLERYLDPANAKNVLSENDKKAERTIAVLFADIKGFTTISESLGKDVLSVLNMTFEALTSCVLQNRGIVDKFIGDCILARWDDNGKDDIGYLASKAAIDMRIALRDLTPKFQEMFGIEIHIGVGINMGQAIVGDIGSEYRSDFTCIGDPVNVASRLEELSEKDDILISKAILNSIIDRAVYDSLGKHKIRGKKEEIEVYKLNELSGRK